MRAERPIIDNIESLQIEKSKPEVIPDFSQKYMFAHIDQIKAARYAREVIDNLDNNGQLEDPSLKGIRETDVYRLRRGLCLPSATSTSINWVKQERVIGDNDGDYRIGDIFDVMVPFHGQDLKSGLEKGWLFTTPQGDIYHQAMLAFAEGLDVSAISVQGFESVAEFKELIDKGGAAAVSFDNRFVLEQTLQNDESLVNSEGQILIESRSGIVYQNFETGRHVVSILSIEGSEAVVLDSFRLPQLNEKDVVLRIPISKLDRYLQNKEIGVSRAILFSSCKEDLSTWESKKANVFVPETVVSAVKDKFKI